MRLYVNSVLPGYDFGCIRLGGDGLANCMLVVARAAILAKKMNATLLRPAWERIGIGQWLRREKDKRYYFNLFKQDCKKGGLKKVFILVTNRHYKEDSADHVVNGIVDVEGLGGYFSDLWGNGDVVKEYFSENILPQAIAAVPKKMDDAIAIHVRLGDNPGKWRTDLGWYVDVIKSINEVDDNARFLLFSDGADEELSSLLALPRVNRVFYGNALADMIAMSRCKLLLGADSTFSGWAAFLGDVPCVFSHLHYGAVLEDRERCLIGASIDHIRKWLKTMI